MYLAFIPCLLFMKALFKQSSNTFFLIAFAEKNFCGEKKYKYLKSKMNRKRKRHRDNFLTYNYVRLIFVWCFIFVQLKSIWHGDQSPQLHDIRELNC